MIYQHYKGGRYTALMTVEKTSRPPEDGDDILFGAFDSNNSADRDNVVVYATVIVGMEARVFAYRPAWDRGEVVVYVSHTTGGINVRSKEEFEELVRWPDGTMQPRFKAVGEYQRPVKPKE